MFYLFIGMFAHGVLAGLLPIPWMVPDLTLVGMVLAIARAPHRWLAYASLAGFGVMCWAIRFPVHVLLSYVIAGGAIRLVATQWDMTDRTVQRVLVGGASLGITLGWMWLDDVWSYAVVAWVLARALMTGLLVPGVRHLRMVSR